MIGKGETMRSSLDPPGADRSPSAPASRRRDRSRHGWALPEVLVLVAVFGLVLFSVWLIWLNTMVAAHREGVKDNLRFLGRGISSYHDTWRSFPTAGYVVRDGKQIPFEFLT